MNTTLLSLYYALVYVYIDKDKIQKKKTIKQPPPQKKIEIDFSVVGSKNFNHCKTCLLITRCYLYDSRGQQRY